jgi:hypothetical protein
MDEYFSVSARVAGSLCSHTAVIARRDRAIQYAAAYRFWH